MCPSKPLEVELRGDEKGGKFKTLNIKLTKCDPFKLRPT